MSMRIQRLAQRMVSPKVGSGDVYWLGISDRSHQLFLCVRSHEGKRVTTNRGPGTFGIVNLKHLYGPLQDFIENYNNLVTGTYGKDDEILNTEYSNSVQDRWGDLPMESFDVSFKGEPGEAKGPLTVEAILNLYRESKLDEVLNFVESGWNQMIHETLSHDLKVPKHSISMSARQVQRSGNEASVLVEVSISDLRLHADLSHEYHKTITRIETVAKYFTEEIYVDWYEATYKFIPPKVGGDNQKPISFSYVFEFTAT